MGHLELLRCNFTVLVVVILVKCLFARDVYLHCAKGWSEETLIEELGYVRKFFDGSEDFKGKELHAITCELCNKLEKKMISPSDACDFIFHFFKYEYQRRPYPF